MSDEIQKWDKETVDGVAKAMEEFVRSNKLSVDVYRNTREIMTHLVTTPHKNSGVLQFLCHFRSRERGLKI
ncbi:MAG: hypothetical protein Q7S14_01700 [bacterium]|nr:hypothetical protein [bacterium]